MITAKMVNELRSATGAGMMDCKKALVETSGDFDAAVDFLRKKGLSAAAKKADRVAAEGVVAVIVAPNKLEGAILEVNSETDFVAKNEKFQELANSLISEYLVRGSSIDEFRTTKMPSGATVQEDIISHVAIIGENIALRRAEKKVVKSGVVTSYVHNQITPGLGRIGVLVGLEGDITGQSAEDLGKKIAMHIAALKPQSLDVSGLDQSLIAKEEAFVREQSATSGKPESVIQKMIEGRMSKFYEQVVLLEQPFVMDGKLKIKELVSDFAKEHNGKLELKWFIRYEVGEGIQKEETNLAAEVAQLAGK